MARSSSAVVLFTLSPQAECRRKSLGLGRPERAAAVFAALIRYLEETCSSLSDVDFLVCTPATSDSAFSSRLLTQRGTGFGESLRLAVEDAFSLGYRRVVVIGNDAPEISRRYLQAAFHELESPSVRAAVLGPARDGGYTLLGLSAPCRDAFDPMPWGSWRVARLTKERLAGAGFTVSVLPTLEDIDNHRTLTRFLARVRRGALADFAKEVAMLLRASPARGSLPIFRVTRTSHVHWRGLRAPPSRALPL